MKTGLVVDDFARAEILAVIVHDSTVGLFEDNGISLAPAQDMPETPIFMCGVVGFSGKNARGSLLCATTFGPIQQLAKEGAANERDWLAEISNQLLGRIKTRLLRRGVEIYLNPPVVLRGGHLKPVRERQNLMPHQFQAATGAVFVWLDIELDPLISLAEEVDNSPLSEGETMMF